MYYEVLVYTSYRETVSHHPVEDLDSDNSPQSPLCEVPFHTPTCRYPKFERNVTENLKLAIYNERTPSSSRMNLVVMIGESATVEISRNDGEDMLGE